MGFSTNLPNCKLLFTSLLVSFGSTFHFGYQLLIPNPAESAFLHFMNSSMHSMGMNPTHGTVETIWGIIVALLFIGAVLGSFSTKFFADRLGRKNGVMLCSVGIALSAGISILSKKLNNFIVFAIGRFVIGAFIGPTLSLTPLLLTECSPQHCRGFVNMAMGLLVVFGTLTGAITAMQEVFGTDDRWWLIYLFEIVVIIVVLPIFPFLYESPMFLLVKGKEKEARKAIAFYHGNDEQDVDKTLIELKEEAKENSKALGMLGVCRDRLTLRGTIVGSMVGLLVGMTGIDVLNSFAVNIMIDCGLSRLTASIAQAGINSISVIAIICSSFIVDSVGRRPFLLISIFVIIVCDIVYSGLLFAFNYYESTLIGILLVITNAVFAFFFGLGPQALAFFVAAEMVPPDARSAAQSYAAFCQMGSGAIAVGLYVPLKNLITRAWAYFVLFAIPCIAFEIFFYFTLPETKNRDFQGVVNEIQKLPSLCGLLKRKGDVNETNNNNKTTELKGMIDGSDVSNDELIF